MATLTWAFALLFRDSTPEGDRRPLPLVPVLLVASYLLWLAPLPDALNVERGFHYLLMLHL